MEKPTPRVNSKLLPNYGGKIVRMIGEVMKLEGETAIIKASDGGQVVVKLSRDAHFSEKYVEVIGRVNAGDNSITEFSSVNMGDNLDMDLVDKVTELTYQHPDMFPNEA